MTQPDRPQQESDLLHTFKNHLSIIVGFCDLLVEEVADGDPRRGDVLEIHHAARAAMALLPQLAARLK